MEPAAIRKSVLDRLERDLVGPDLPEEVLKGRSVRPSDVYLTGILWPLGERMSGSDDDGSAGDDEDDDGPSTPGVVGQQRPCAMGISIATRSDLPVHQVAVVVKFATYEANDTEDEKGRSGIEWARRQHVFSLDEMNIPSDSTISIPISLIGLPAEVLLHVRGKSAAGGLLSTFTVVNRSRPEVQDRRSIELMTLFQVSIEITALNQTRIVPRPRERAAVDEDDRAGLLLYRNVPEFAAGHLCSASWKAVPGQEFTNKVFSSWIPSAEVTAIRPDGHALFRESVTAGKFNVAELAACSDKELAARLALVTESYAQWIDLQRTRIASLPKSLVATATEHLKVCDSILERMRKGANQITQNSIMRDAFQLANLAMSSQHAWKRSGASLSWYPFQLGFILLAACSVCDPTADDRDTLDLLWFPTGGGKTEAYLAIIAMLAFHRRLSSKKPDTAAGTAAVMRYTLRLLTAQQFERASAMILACDLIRLGRIVTSIDVTRLGKTAFSIGLWVGGDATPNNFEKAVEARGQRDGTTAEQIERCPCCHARVQWNYDESAKRVDPFCENDDCALGSGYGLWPVFTVDTDLYRELPTLVIGTIDKFALLPTRVETSDLFGFSSNNPPDLIIQDELHLISGPLGTIAGLYETAFDWLLTRDGRRPKVIGSTATIRRASQQVRALFDRTSCQFPPPGIDHDDSGFAVRDDSRPGRVYLGVTTAGRSAKFALQAVAGSLLQSAGQASIPDSTQRDGYSTLLAYFNSLRELGGAIVQMLDDVPDSIALYAQRRGEIARIVKEPRELTSRVSQKEIVEILEELKRPASDPDSVDVVLATNMVSVGVDVSRLGLMVVNGQPKTRSEYIQATSRVGRAKFPGLVVSVLNAGKPRDRSHYETFQAWHQTLYRDVEATSVTPFASRARDRALHAVLVSMIRHGAAGMSRRPDLSQASAADLQAIISEVERRITAIDPGELSAAISELDWRMEDWEARVPMSYSDRYKPNKSLLQAADRHAQRRAAGRSVGAAWPTMNNMRSVEPGSRFRMAEVLANRPAGNRGPATGTQTDAAPDAGSRPAPRWRRNG